MARFGLWKGLVPLMIFMNVLGLKMRHVAQGMNLRFGVLKHFSLIWEVRLSVLSLT